jgi:hypothetical protein
MVFTHNKQQKKRGKILAFYFLPKHLKRLSCNRYYLYTAGDEINQHTQAMAGNIPNDEYLSDQA